MHVNTGDPEVWRPSPGAQVGIYFVVMFLVVFAIGFSIQVINDGYGLLTVGIIAFTLPGVVVGLLYVHRCRVLIHDDDVEVIRIIGRRAVPWDEIVRAEPGYWGVTLSLTDGSRTTAGAVQKTNAAVWAKRRTRADDLADLINSRAAGSASLGDGGDLDRWPQWRRP